MKFSTPKGILLLVFTCLLFSNKLFSQDIFETHDSYSIGPSPGALKAGDFNNDGFMDMVSANGSPLTNSNRELSILINDGQGKFSVTNIDLDPSFHHLETADFNNDGNLDFVVISLTDDEMVIFLGIGNGSFTSNTVNVGDLPDDIEVGDFNEDTNLDIAVLHRASADDLHIYYGDGTGNVGSPQVIAVQTSAVKMTVADFNNDNHLDLLIGGNFTAEFYAGDGMGNFSAAVPSTGFIFGFDFVHSADINNDGNIDLIGNGQSRIFTALGAGDGSFSGFSFSDEGNKISLADDFDGDGNIDLVSTESHKIIYYPGDGTGVFTEFRRIPMDVGAAGLAAADWNEDGNLDIALASPNGTSTSGVVQVVFGKGDGYFNAPYEYPLADNPRGMTQDDFNEDGLEDIATCVRGLGTGIDNIYIHLGQSDGSFTNTSIFDGGAFPEDIKALHINGDIHIDLAVLDRNNNLVNFYSGDGTGSFSFVGDLVVTSNFTLAVDDVNKDNITDLILAGNTSTAVQIFEGNGDNTFSLLADVVVGEPVSDAQIVFIDADTNPDLIIAVNQAVGDDQIRFYQGDGTGTFTPVGASIDLTGSSTNGKLITQEDLNNDGHIDFIAVGSGATGHIIMGDGSFALSQSSMAGGIGELKSAGAKDFDGDGIKDLVFGTDNLVVSPDGFGFVVYKGNGDGSFGSILHSKKFVGGYRMIIADFNDDNRNDIATLVNNGVFNGLSISLNNTAPPTCTTPSITVDPTAITFCEDGTDHLIFVNATGDAPLTFQWQKDGFNIPGALNSATFTLSNYTSAESGVYRCIVSNACGSDTSTGATITINALPIAPVTTGAANCMAASLTLTATGSIDGNYRWYDVAVGGVPLVGEVNSSFITPVLSTTTDYYVTINDGTCESGRIVVTATILTPVSISSQPQSQTVKLGDNVTFTIGATGDNVGYQWQKDAANLIGETSSSLLLTGVTSTDAGEYSCIVSNACGSDTSLGGTLTINALPSPPVTKGAVDCIVASLTLTATGSIDGNYRWYDVAVGGIPLVGQVNSSFITPVLSTTTDYYVTINDGICESSRTVITAAILTPVSISSQPQSQTVELGDNVTFTIGATGDNVGYQWQKDAANLIGETSLSLLVTGVTSADVGEYSCNVSNVCSTEVSSTVTLSNITITKIDEHNSNSLVIYPNPSSGHIHFEGYLSRNLSINIYSMDGQIVYSGFSKLSQTTIDLSRLPDGIYQAIIGDGINLYHKRIHLHKEPFRQH